MKYRATIMGAEIVPNTGEFDIKLRIRSGKTLGHYSPEILLGEEVKVELPQQIDIFGWGRDMRTSAFEGKKIKKGKKK